MLLAGRQTNKNRAFFWFRGGFYGFGLWEVKMLWVWIMGVTLVKILLNPAVVCATRVYRDSKFFYMRRRRGR